MSSNVLLVRNDSRLYTPRLVCCLARCQGRTRKSGPSAEEFRQAYIVLYGAESWKLRAVDQKHPESFEMWFSRRMEKISWTDHVRNEEVLLRVK
jgi:hypothetical protein